MKFKLNPLTGEFDYTSESANKQKLNPLTGEFNLVEGDGPFSQIFNPLTGTFNLGTRGGGGIIAEVTGNGYINLTNAVANRLMELKAYGGTEQRNLPSGYTQLEYVYMTAGSYIKVEDLLISSGYRVEFDFQTTTLGSTLRNYIGGRANGVAAGGGFRLSKLASGGTTLNRVVLYGFESGTEFYDPTVAFQPNTKYHYTYGNGVCTLESGGSVVSTQTFTITDNNSTKRGINAYVSGNDYWQTDSDGIYVYSLKIWNEQDELVMDLVPAKTSTEIGFYDKVTGTLRTATAGTFEAGSNTPTPDIPVDIICNNGVLKFSKNMANVNTQTALVGYYISAQGQVLESPYNRIYQEFIPCKPNTKYTISMSPSVYFISISEYSTAEDSGFIRRSAGSTGGNTQLTITTRSNTNYLRFGANLSSSNITIDDVLAINWQLEQGDTPTPYHEYVEGGVYADGITETIGFGGVFSSADGQGTFVSPSAATTTRIYKAFGKLVTGTYTVEIDGPFDFIFQYKDTLDTTPTNYGNIGTRTKSGEYEITDTTLYYGVAIRNDSGTGNIRPADFVSGNGKLSIKGTDGNVVAEMLLKVGDYADEQEMLSGNITRKVAIKVLDGTEAWAQATTSQGVYRYRFEPTDAPKIDGSRGHCMSTHFVDIGGVTTQDVGGVFASTSYLYFIPNQTLNTVAKRTAFLTAQYNAGTPVIALYPLKEEATETVARQTMHIPAGTSTIGVVQASLDNLGLYAKYLQSN